MRMVSLTLVAGCLAVQLSGATIGFQASSLGGNTFRYTYSISGFTFQANQELDIFFDPLVYDTLFNGKASSDFNLLLFQPNNPPGTPGDYSATALVNNPSLAGPFSVDFTLKPGGQPGPQPFTIFDQNFTPITSGFTTPQGVGVVPEPASLSLAFAGLFSGSLLWSVKRRARRKA